MSSSSQLSERAGVERRSSNRRGQSSGTARRSNKRPRHARASDQEDDDDDEDDGAEDEDEDEASNNAYPTLLLPLIQQHDTAKASLRPLYKENSHIIKVSDAMQRKFEEQNRKSPVEMKMILRSVYRMLLFKGFIASDYIHVRHTAND